MNDVAPYDVAPSIARPSLSKVSLIFACGTALFSDGYANGVIGSVNTLLQRIYGKAAVTGHNYSTALNSSVFAGTIVGMLTFGWISDKLGRKFGMMTANVIVLLFTFLSACSQGAHDSLGGKLAMLTAMRFFLGIGIGAEYPCGSVSASEQSEEAGINKRSQNKYFALATNSMIDTGFVISAFVPLVLFWIFGNDHLRIVWRASLALGIFPCAAVFIWRLRMEEPTRYKQDSMKNIKIPYGLILRRYGKSLFGICLSWFIYDFITYPFGIYSSTILDAVEGNSTSLTVIFGWNTVIQLFYIPGTFVGAMVVDYLGPKNTMIIGLLLQAIMGFIMSALYDKLAKHIAAFAVVYGLFLTFGEFGPGNCLGLLAAKSGPTAVRGQYYGLAAAVGKIGAFVGVWLLPVMEDAFHGNAANTGPFWIGSGLALVSAASVLIFVRPLNADAMTNEDAAFRVYLAEHGFDTTQMGLRSEVESVGSLEKEKEEGADVVVNEA